MDDSYITYFDVGMYFEDGEFIIEYGDNRKVSVSMDEKIQELAKQTLADGNFWTAFLAGLSGAIDAAKVKA